MRWAKPSMSVAETVTFCEEPTTRPRVGALTDSEKLPESAVDAVTVSVRSAEAVSAPAVPVNSTVAVPGDADAVAARLTCGETPGVIVKLEGVAVTPGGKPLTVT